MLMDGCVVCAWEMVFGWIVCMWMGVGVVWVCVDGWCVWMGVQMVCVLVGSVLWEVACICMDGWCVWIVCGRKGGVLMGGWMLWMGGWVV